MGAKTDLAPKVSHVVKSLPPGPLLDAFAGTCAVAGEVAQTGRVVWCNDVQAYAALIARALLTIDAPPASDRVANALRRSFCRNRKALRSRFCSELSLERSALRNGSRRALQRVQEGLPHVGSDTALANEVASLRAKPVFPHRLVTLTFAASYFGLEQAIDLDSIRYAIDKEYAEDRLTTADRTWLLAALLQTASQTSATTGHFAEYLRPHSDRAFLRIKAMRQRDVWTQFLIATDRASPLGTSNWRRQNRVFNEDAVTAISRLPRNRQIAAVYADPPYSRAQYSRHYHVLETLTLYDYPSSTGVGRYRSNRFQTPFSHASSVEEAFDHLVLASARKRCALVISYPSDGLLYERGVSPAAVMRRYYRRVHLAAHQKKSHSTLGGSGGRARRPVRELLFVASEAQ